MLLLNVRAVLPERVSEETNLHIQDGLIRRVFSSPSDLLANDSSPADSTLDLQGLTLYPGFIDVHIHGAVGVDTMAAGTQDLDRVSQFLAKQGVTGWLPTLVPAPDADYARAIAAIDRAMKEVEELEGTPSQEQAGCLRSQGARILGVHYEGPFVNSAQCGALRGKYFKTYSGPGDLEDLPLPISSDAARMITLAPEVAGGVELVRELKRRGWIVSIGHTRAGFELLDQAFEAGARHMTHFMNAMAPLHHRSPGPIAWGLSHDDVTCDVIADGIHLDPHMLQLLLKLKGADRLTLISDSIAAAGQGDGVYGIWGESITVKDGRTSNAHGSIAGSVITLDDARRLMQSLGASEVGLAKMAATNPARLLGIDGDCGSIEEGKRADLVALDQDGNVRHTIVGGHLAFSSQPEPSI